MNEFARYFCIFALPLTLSGCGDLCVMFCTDQTRIQRQYVDSRDECRDLAELKAGLNEGEDAPDKNTKTKLVGLFSDCMGNRGWAVPGPGDEKKGDKPGTVEAVKAEPNALPLPNPTLPPPSPQKVEDVRARRSAECTFARQSADSSVIAKKRAEACDMECSEMTKAAPEAPRPAACP